MEMILTMFPWNHSGDVMKVHVIKIPKLSSRWCQSNVWRVPAATFFFFFLVSNSCFYKTNWLLLTKMPLNKFRGEIKTFFKKCIHGVPSSWQNRALCIFRIKTCKLERASKTIFRTRMGAMKLLELRQSRSPSPRLLFSPLPPRGQRERGTTGGLDSHPNLKYALHALVIPCYTIFYDCFFCSSLQIRVSINNHNSDFLLLHLISVTESRELMTVSILCLALWTYWK